MKNKLLKQIHITSAPLEIASYANYKEATFLISVLDEPDLYGRIITKECGEACHSTIIGYPIVAKLVTDRKGNPIDFGGHEVKIEKLADGTKRQRFMTIPIGSILESWIETREVPGYEGEKECILIKAKLWSSRFPEYFEVFDKLWEQGEVQSSWELTVLDSEENENGNKIIKALEFIGNALLGAIGHQGAVPSAGVLEYAELENDNNAELSDALFRDVSSLGIENIENMEATDLKKKNIENLTASTENVEAENQVAESSTNEPTNTKTEENAEVNAEGTVENNETAESADNTDAGESNNEIASLTQRDLRRRIEDALWEKTHQWYWIMTWFPEEHTIWCEPEYRESELDISVFTYEVNDDVVTVSDEQKATLSVSVRDINTQIASLNEQITNLQAELDKKNEAVIEASEQINALNVKISELEPYKAQVEEAEQKKIEEAIESEKKCLKDKLAKAGFSEEEIAEASVAELIEARNESAIKGMIADKYLASLDNATTETQVVEVNEVSSTEEKPENIVASLESNDDEEVDARSFMRGFLFH